jgi:hypothetical protein
MKEINHWTHICIEAFCSLFWEYKTKHSKHVYELVKKKGSFMKKNGRLRTKKVPNLDYEEGIQKPTPPEFCDKHLGFNCLAHKCEFLAYSEARKKDLKKY